MRRLDGQIRKWAGGARDEAISQEAVRKTVQRAQEAFCEHELQGALSGAEFLFWQSKYIRKRWWFFQAAVLLVLWGISSLPAGEGALPRCMGVSACLFAVLLLPELWKNRSAGAVEVECASRFSLRQVYAARIFLFALADLLLLGSFSAAAVASGRLGVQNLMINFFLPYAVACCICFRCLYSRRAGSEFFSVFLCLVWTGIWTQILLCERVYSSISLPVWWGMLAAAVFYLGYCIRKGQKECERMGEVSPLWN